MIDAAISNGNVDATGSLHSEDFMDALATLMACLLALNNTVSHQSNNMQSPQTIELMGCKSQPAQIPRAASNDSRQLYPGGTLLICSAVKIF